jgi:hypothetical protein
MPVAPNNTLKFLAQAFSVANPGEATGIYLTKIGLFFKKKGNASSIRVSLLEMKNGFPDRNSVLPNSVVTLNSDAVGISDNASSETLFEFSQPIFLDATKQYCFAIQSPSPDFTIWGAERGERDVATNKIVNNNPLTESAFYSESNAEYSELPSQDIKFVLYRAKFNVATAGIANLRNKENVEYLKLSNTSIIENLIPYSTDKICNLYFPTVEKAKFVDLFPVNGGEYVMLVETNSANSFTAGEEIVLYRETVVDGVTYRTELLSGTVDDILNYEYHSVFPRLNIDKKTGTEVAFSLKGAVADGDSYSIESGYNTVITEYAERVFPDKSRYMLSYSSENSVLSDSSIQLRTELSTSNEYVAPIIRFDSSHLALLTNIINNDTTNEETRDGLAEAKYISRIVTLADGMDAEDIKVYIDAYKPKNTEVHVYGKFQNAEDFSNFDTLEWIKLTQVTPENVYSDPKDQTDFREFEYEIPGDDGDPDTISYKNAATGIFEYNSGSETGKFIGFKKYSIKVVLTTETDYEFNPPKVTDLRVIALQR